MNGGTTSASSMARAEAGPPTMHKNLRRCVQHPRDAELQAPQFRESAQAPDDRIAGTRRRGTLEVVEQHMPVIRTQPDAPVSAAGAATPGLLGQQRMHD